MSVVNMIVGAVTPDGATITCKVDGGGPVRVAVADNASMDSPVFTGSQAVDAQGVATVSITGLAAHTRHWWQVEDNSVLDASATGQVLTLPVAGVAASFTIGYASCAGGTPDHPGVAGGELDPNRVSNSPIFDTVRQRALAEGWLGFYLLGDHGYPNFGTDTTDTLANRRKYFDDNLAQPNQAALWREVANEYFWDDHDFAGDNSDGTYVDKANAAQVHRERSPAYPLPDANATYRSWDVGRVLFLGADVRYDKSPNSDPDGPSKTMLGSAQKSWMEQVLAASDAKLLVWMMPGQWMGTGADTWASYQTEQAEVIQMFTDLGFAGRLLILGADAHMVALDTGGNSPGGIPVLQAAALDSSPTGNPGIYDLGGQSGRDQYGTLTVEDLGLFLRVTLSGWQGNGRLVTHSFTVPGDPATPAAAGALIRTLAGSHEARFEARVLADFQTGPDPDGPEIPIVAGDVQMDGTADVQRTLELTTEGDDWPRTAGDLLAPYGTELFVRRGIDLGSQVIWVPLGYFRINSVEQDDAPHGPIRISATDRMQSILDGRLTEPRAFASNRTVASVFGELVNEIYPTATVLFDDATGGETLGRQILAEQSRYEVLRDLADSRGKLMYWDGDGILRLVTAPDPGDPVWQVRAGRGGVQLHTGRRITRDGVYNGVVATGEGAGDTDPVRAVAVDANPNSPTVWGGRFGRVPRFYSSPLLTNQSQAANAARQMLRRAIGMPYNVDFTAVVNPALLPDDPVLVIYQDGNRELHVVETLTVPLDAGAAMAATTREQTLIQVEV